MLFNGDFFAFVVRITEKILKIDGYQLRGVWQALNCLSNHVTYCVIIAGASPGETKMLISISRVSVLTRARQFADAR